MEHIETSFPLTQLLHTIYIRFVRILLVRHLTRKLKVIGGVGMQNTLKAKLKTDINWNTSIFMIIFHLGAVGALFLFSWKWLAVSLMLKWVAGSLGIGIGYHRLLTHRGFRTPKWVEYFLVF